MPQVESRHGLTVDDIGKQVEFGPQRDVFGSVGGWGFDVRSHVAFESDAVSSNGRHGGVVVGFSVDLHGFKVDRGTGQTENLLDVIQ